MLINKSPEDLNIISFEKAKECFDAGHRYMAWYGYSEDGKIYMYNDAEFKYPAPYNIYPKI